MNSTNCVFLWPLSIMGSGRPDCRAFIMASRYIAPIMATSQSSLSLIGRLREVSRRVGRGLAYPRAVAVFGPRSATFPSLSQELAGPVCRFNFVADDIREGHITRWSARFVLSAAQLQKVERLLRELLL